LGELCLHSFEEGSDAAVLPGGFLFDVPMLYAAFVKPAVRLPAFEVRAYTTFQFQEAELSCEPSCASAYRVYSFGPLHQKSGNRDLS